MLPAREAGFSTDRRGPPTPVARHRASDDATGARQALEIAVAGCGSCRSPSRNKALTLQRVFDLIARSGAGRRGYGPTGDPGAKAPGETGNPADAGAGRPRRRLPGNRMTLTGRRLQVPVERLGRRRGSPAALVPRGSRPSDRWTAQTFHAALEVATEALTAYARPKTRRLVNTTIHRGTEGFVAPPSGKPAIGRGKVLDLEYLWI